MKQDPYWFFKKWGFEESVPMDEIYERLSELEQRVLKLEDENIGTTNAIYELENSLDARIDILAEQFRTEWDV
jgi:peptidoglycan hydrolase CwlO-like protein